MFGVSRRLSAMIDESSTKASLGIESGVAVDVTQSGAPPTALVATHPVGNAGATTPSKFCVKAVPAQGVAVGDAVEGGVAVAAAVAVDVAVAVAAAVDVAVAVGVDDPPGVGVAHCPNV